MIDYARFLILSVLLIAIQSLMTDMVFSNFFVFEMSLIVVLYMGFHWDLIKGTFGALFLGFLVDCVSGSVLGVFAGVYMVVFFLSFFVSDLLDIGKKHIIMLLGVLAALLKGVLLKVFYRLAFDVPFMDGVPYAMLMQALLLGLVSPFLFYGLDRSQLFMESKKV